jgi:diguanylate cyclase (GGDEF)-like protein
MSLALVIDSQPERASNSVFTLQQQGYKVVQRLCGAPHWESLIGLRPRFNDLTSPTPHQRTGPTVSPPDLILLQVDGWQDAALNDLIALKTANQTKNIPVIVLSASNDPKTFIYSLDLGANDCLQEPYIPSVLAAKIRSVMQQQHKINQLEKSNAELHQLASIDPLTQVCNRRHFFQHSRSEFARAQRYNRKLAVIMLDIDNFKRVNDDYGHAAGDSALVSVADSCRYSVRDSDIVGRLGGEEFAICCPETDVEGAYAIAERIRVICESTPLFTQETCHTITVSLGVTCLQHHDNSLEQLLQRADKLLYEAKEKGRNRALFL